MDPSCLVSMVHAGVGGVMGIYSWHTLGPLVPIEHRFNATLMHFVSFYGNKVHYEYFLFRHVRYLTLFFDVSSALEFVLDY